MLPADEGRWASPKKKGSCPVTDTTAVTWGVPLGLEAPPSRPRPGKGKARALESAVGRVTRGSWGGWGEGGDRSREAGAGGGAVSRAPSPPRPPALNDRAAGDLG